MARTFVKYVGEESTSIMVNGTKYSFSPNVTYKVPSPHANVLFAIDGFENPRRIKS